MKIAPVAEVKAHFSSYLEECEEGPVIVTKNGRPVAVLVSIQEEEDLERFVLAHTPKYRKLLEEAERRIGKKGGIEHKDFWKSIQPKRKGKS